MQQQENNDNNNLMTMRAIVPIQDVSEILSKYDFKEKIGTGGFATVMRAIEKETGVEVAIKIVDKQKYAPTDKSYEREFQVLSTLRHENIVNLHCTYISEKNVFMVTEVVHGGELLERITEEGSYSEADARRIIVQILKAVEYLHSKKVVHRDIKLENILMSDRSAKATVKLIDFGLSRLPQDGSEMRTICGSPLYVAPEILYMNLSDTAYTPAVDLWSVGVILFILLSGYSPFDHDDEEQLFKNIKEGMYCMDDRIWRYISEGAKDCVRQLLTVDVMNRMTATQTLQHPWIRQKHRNMNNNNDNNNNDSISNMTSQTTSTGFLSDDRDSLTNSMNMAEQMPKDILEEKQNRLKQRLESIRMIREEESLAMDIAIQQDSDNTDD